MILMYHNVVPDDPSPGTAMQSITLTVSAFERQIRWLKRFYSIISLDEYMDIFGKRGKIPNRTLALTFDDGTYTTYEYAQPVLEKYKAHATIFVNTCQLDDGPLIWGAYLNALCYEEIYDRIEFNGRTFTLNNVQTRQELRSEMIQQALESGDSPGFIQAFSKKYPIPTDILYYYKGMSSEQLKHAGSNEFMEIAAHTHNHPFLTSLNENQQSAEILESRRILEEKTGKPVRYFAFPSGAYNEATIAILQKAGFEAAFAVKSKGIAEDIKWEFPRVGIFSPSLLKLQVKLWKS